MTVRAMAFTALVARKGLGFFFFGTGRSLTAKDPKHAKELDTARSVTDKLELEQDGPNVPDLMLSGVLRALCGYDVLNGRARFF
jgi:hypothetical protein